MVALPSEWGGLAIALLVSLAGIVFAWMLFGRGPRPAAEPTRGLARAVKDKLYVDEIIESVVLKPYDALCRFASAFDEILVDGLVNAVGAATDLAGQMIRLTQTGYVRSYAFVFFLGTILVLLFLLR